MPGFLGMMALLLVAGGGLLLQYLARHPLVPEPTAISTPAPPPATSPPQPPAPAEPLIAADESTAEKALADWRQALGDLEAVGGPDWAPDAFAVITREATAADDAFLQADYAGAAQHYTTAAQDARHLQARAPEVLSQLLAEGQSALDLSLIHI